MGTSSCSTLPEATARAPRLRAYTSSNLEAPQQTGACTDWYDGASGEYITTTGDYSSGGSGYYYGGENHTGTGANAGGGYTGGTGGMGGGGDYGGSNGSSSFNPADVYLYEGQKPLGEYTDKCTGMQQLWKLGIDNNVETAGVITADGKFMIVAIVGASGGAFGGLYHHDTGVGSGTDYYQWPSSQGAPTQTYQGMVLINGHYYIPIVATVHTHTPCVNDGTDGISNMTLSSADQNLANKFNRLTHYIVGCNALGTFDNRSNSPAVLTTGQLATTCASL